MIVRNKRSQRQKDIENEVPEEPILKEKAPVRAYLVPKDKKASIRKQLAAVNINHFTVYGDLPALCRHLSGIYD